jgi:hypothetical protein
MRERWSNEKPKLYKDEGGRGKLKTKLYRDEGGME